MGIFNKIKKVFNKEEKEIKIYNDGLEKTRENFTKKINILGKKFTKIDGSFYDELEEIMILADIGVNTVVEFIDRLKKRVKSENIIDFEYLKEVIVDELFLIYVGSENLSNKINYCDDDISVLLFVGVNGVGKTTSIAKFASKLKKDGKKVLLIAGDTFRAGAIKQLEEWAKTTDVLFYGNSSNDPSSVIYDGLVYAKKENVDVVLVDTAGRLQNKTNLMSELDKINRVIKKVIKKEPNETLLVIDASTGQNGIIQAKSFKDVTDITGIILTKLDGTSKGGIVLAIKEGLNIPVKYVGFGEREEDLMEFDIEKYIYGLFKGLV